MSKTVLSIFQIKAHCHEYNVDDDGYSDDGGEGKKCCELKESADDLNCVFHKPYGTKLFVKNNIIINMNWIILILFVITGSISSIPSALAETDYFPGECCVTYLLF